MRQEEFIQTSTLFDYISNILSCEKLKEFHPVGLEVGSDASLCTNGGAGSASENVQVYNHYQNF